MTGEKRAVDFFLGANSPKGFVSYFSELSDPDLDIHSFVIKGGPGTGKSGLMKKAAAAMEKKDALIENIHCSSDADSLDAVIFHAANATIADGTAPHVIEPQFPGAYDTVVNLCACWDEDRLRAHREEILQVSRENKKCHARCVRFLTAANALLSDNYLIALEQTDTAKIGLQAERIAAKEFGKKTGKAPVEHKRLLSAVTPQGLITYTNTAKTLCDKLYLIKDDYGASSHLLLAALRSIALEYGLEVYACYCPLNPSDKLEHLFIPELGLGFMTSSRINPIEVEADKVMYYTRFTDTDALKRKKQRLAFNRKAAAELLGEAVASLKNAKAIHDELESYYTAAVDFKQVSAMTEDVIAQIKKLY